jgi:hypothetical protein
MRLVRVLLGQLIAIGLTACGGVQVPVINMSIGAFITAVFKFLREKFPNSKILAWLPL